MRQGTGCPVSSSTTETFTQFLPGSISSIRARGPAAEPLDTTAPHFARAMGVPPCFTLSVADGVAETSTYDGLAVSFCGSPQPLFGRAMNSSAPAFGRG